ncbi:branched-chain amino acid transaminase [Cuniculiplasma divulgatum]|jgi:branched-chain amino acid aminotransferase|uniref:Branched-chain-amino-acid aminotransferase n=1 Tax=Cuniculiplasma divulgatum TaxID=1673428 RepID=A0A1N5WPK4_9ARCH|nr:branched-chain amino acid transaminase [Cuniculiplasma divulgatum]EQB68816.1 MAG: Branched-chain amino acid aminotransferase [Thermoplasmatales archaeon Gpl]WMT50050.1 MAG: branched-chain amino acid transaminase [Thermoplasmatales archaeon]SIM87151.1 branched-chain amino acid aminotransferase [Cuniculiplasma divulgatum]
MTDEKLSWLNGNFIDEEKAVVPIMTHSLQYGSGIFEGIRGYETPKGTEIFRLKEHVKRFFNTAKIYGMNLGFSEGDIEKAIIEVVRRNKLKSCYIRPFAFYDDHSVGVGTAGKKISVYIGAFPFGKYFSAADTGLKCKVSSWHRMESSILPIEAKASGNYLNSVIAMKEAKASGFDEAILTSRDGYVAEGPGENIFIVKDGALLTPGRDSQILLGITRNTIIELMKENGMQVIERFIHREELYTADEAFFVGTAAEVTPILNIDGITIGDGKVGSITKKVWETYFNLVQGKSNTHQDYLTYV